MEPAMTSLLEAHFSNRQFGGEHVSNAVAISVYAMKQIINMVAQIKQVQHHQRCKEFCSL